MNLVLDSIIYIVIFCSYAFAGYSVIWFLQKWINSLHDPTKIVIQSMTYASIFGFGMLKSRGDPGFVFICPIPIGAAYGIWHWIPVESYIKGVIFPFLFWWLVIPMVLVIRKRIVSGKV